MKQQKGITLIALIITIIVLLILAVVAIGAVQESGIITHAQKAATDYNSAKADEESTISGYESLIEENLPGGAEDSDSEPVDTTLSLGKTIYYDSNNDNKKEEWIVYSVDGENNFEIISANSMGNLKLGYEDPYLPATVGDLNGNGTAEENIDKAIYSYNHAIESINNYCALLVTATDNSGVRSIGATTEQDTVGIEYLNVFKGEDAYGEEAITYLTNLGGNDYLTSKDSNNYWIASRNYLIGGAHHFNIYQIGHNEVFGDSMISEKTENLVEIIYVPLYGVQNTDFNDGKTKSAGVRPIILNPINYSFTNN